jgi:hypothetical protein
VAVDLAVSREYLQQELVCLNQLAAACSWNVAADVEHLLVVVTMQAHTGDRFVVEARCDDYREVPPFFEFIDPDNGDRGTRRAYPKTMDSFFHDSGPCICAPFNRKAYKSVVPSGPHADWAFGDWQTSTASNVPWANYSTLAGMYGLIYTRISRPQYYLGRMA